MAGFLRQFRMHHESENSEAVVHRNDDDALLSQMRTLLPDLGRGTGDEAATVNPDHDGQLRFHVFIRNPDVQGEAIFARPGIVKYHVAEDFSLHAVRTELRGFLHASPLRGGSWSLPAQLADRRRGVRNAEEDFDLTVVLAFDSA